MLRGIITPTQKKNKETGQNPNGHPHPHHNTTCSAAGLGAMGKRTLDFLDGSASGPTNPNWPKDRDHERVLPADDAYPSAAAAAARRLQQSPTAAGGPVAVVGSSPGASSGM